MPATLIKCAFVSVWSDGSEVVSDCELDPSTGQVSPHTVDVDPDGCLVGEHITLADGTELPVCFTCHSHILKTEVGERADLSYGEYKVCSDPNCEGI